MIKKKLLTFVNSESAVGVIIFLSTLFSLIIANSAGYQTYEEFFTIIIPIRIDSIMFFKEMTIRDWINDGLMAIFFLLIGLELKREILIGELSSVRRMMLPLFAAVGGVIMPAIIFTAINIEFERNLYAFAVPCATDIAFAYAIISFFGNRISNSLKIFLVTLAVIDDIIAILIIALFYSHGFDRTYLILAFDLIVILLMMNFLKVKYIAPYLFFGFLLWLVILKSGIHSTIAGVILAMLIPLQIGNKKISSHLASQITPIVNFLILPVFAFANAGVKYQEMIPAPFLESIILGIVLALFIGKQLGVMLFSYISIKLNLTSLPKGTDWFEFWGISIFTGIGFTMSLFIGSLSFIRLEPQYDAVKIAVFIGSLLSVLFGFFITTIAIKKRGKI